jgi:hypothetical protein
MSPIAKARSPDEIADVTAYFAAPSMRRFCRSKRVIPGSSNAATDC